MFEHKENNEVGQNAEMFITLNIIILATMVRVVNMT